jgi:dihydroxy-acid dehydratase
MSGTAYGTVVLHIAPEAAAGGPLAFVRNGDMIELDVEGRSLHLDISDAEMEKRKKGWNGFETPHKRGYASLYVERVLQADKGADLDFLVGKSGTPKLRESH